MNPQTIVSTKRRQGGGIRSCLVMAAEILFADMLASFLTAGDRRAEMAVLNREGQAAFTGHDLLVLVVPPEEPATAWASATGFLRVNPGASVIVIVDRNLDVGVPAEIETRVTAVVDRHAPLWHLWNAIEQGAVARPLSSREAEVLHLIGQGYTNRQIGTHLGLATHTIRHHRKRIAAKLQTEGPELVRWATLATTTTDSSMRADTHSAGSVKR